MPASKEEIRRRIWELLTEEDGVARFPPELGGPRGGGKGPGMEAASQVILARPYSFASGTPVIRKLS